MSRRPLWQYLLLDWAIWVLAGLIADAIEPRYRALVLLATFGTLRWGELAGLRRRNLDLEDRCVRVTETVYEFGQLVQRHAQVQGEHPHGRPSRTDHLRAAAAPGHLRGPWPGRLRLCRC